MAGKNHEFRFKMEREFSDSYHEVWQKFYPQFKITGFYELVAIEWLNSFREKIAKLNQKGLTERQIRETLRKS